MELGEQIVLKYNAYYENRHDWVEEEKRVVGGVVENFGKGYG